MTTLFRDITRQDTKKIVRLCIFLISIFTIIGYAIFTSHDFISGPYLEILEPTNGSTLTTPRVTVRGLVKRIQDITLNDRPITIDEKGKFNEIELLAPGYNIFSIKVKDKFGRSEEYRLELIYKVD